MIGLFRDDGKDQRHMLQFDLSIIQMPQAFDDVVVKVFDGAGRVVFTSQYGVLQGNTTINLSNIAAGTYNVMLSNNKGTSVRRLSIVR